jgi:hypothetical protein
MAGDVFKSVMLLRGIPVDTFFEAMGMFANAMGNDCTFCHAFGRPRKSGPRPARGDADVSSSYSPGVQRMAGRRRADRDQGGQVVQGLQSGQPAANFYFDERAERGAAERGD